VQTRIHATPSTQNIGRIDPASASPGTISASAAAPRRQSPARLSSSQPYSDATTPSRNGTSVRIEWLSSRNHELIPSPNVTQVATHGG
jgi:hypothetical protein